MKTSNLRYALALAAVVFFCSGCRAFEPEGAAPLEIPAAYRTWWAELEKCAQRSGNLERIRFLTVKGETFPCPNGPVCAGRWQSPHHVYIAERWVDNPSLVKHEMLHDLLNTGEHPVEVFGPTGCNVLWDPAPAIAGS